MLLCQLLEIVDEVMVESAGECSFEAAPDLSIGFALGASSLDVGTGFWAGPRPV